jgi:hypothetical protein
MNPPSIREQILVNLDARLKTITAANGYNTDINAAHVFRWLSRDILDAEMPAINYKDIECSEQETGPDACPIGMQQYTLTVELELHVATATTTPTSAVGFIADIQTAVGVDYTFGGLANRTEYGGDSSEEELHELTIGRTTLKLKIVFRTMLWNPYAQ